MPRCSSICLFFRSLLAMSVLTSTAWAQAAGRSRAAADDALIPVGVARVDVTPDGPIRQNGYAARKTESTGVAQRLWVKALAIGSDEQGPAILVTVDNCVVPAALTDEVARRLEKRAHIRRERFVVCASHTHAGPCLKGAAPFIFGEPTPPEHQARIDRYTERFADCLEQVALDSLAARRPGRLAWAQGRVTFATNRRVVKDGRWVHMAHNPTGPVDHDLPVLRVTDADGRLRAVLVNYACHAVTVRSDQLHGDWPGSQLCLPCSDRPVRSAPWRLARERMVKHAADDLRNSVWALRTAPLAGQSLPESLRSLVSQLGVDKPGMIALHLEGESFPLPRFVAGNLLLVAQEAIRNAQHHANATLIDVTVRFDAHARSIRLIVADDGSGFEWGTQLGPERGHFGLQGMRERVVAIRGRFTVETSPGRGTTVTAEVAVQPFDAGFQQEDDCPDAEAPTPG